MWCEFCGKEYSTTSGICPCNYGMMAPKTPYMQYKRLVGWRCPNCGIGVSPYETICPCGPKYKVTIGVGSEQEL